ILATRDERGHAADSVGPPTMARPHEQVRICPHEGYCHRHLGPIGQDELLPIPELLDDAEDVVPPARVEARGVVPEFVQDLLHLEGRRNRLDEGGGLHGADRDAEGLLREPEHLVPEASLQMALHLRQVEVRAGPAGSKLLRVVAEIEPEVHQAPRDRYAVDNHVLLREFPTTERGRLRKEVEHVAAIDPNLALCAAMQEILTRPIEVAMQVREEREGFAGEDRAAPSDYRCADLCDFDGWSLHAVSARPASV